MCLEKFFIVKEFAGNYPGLTIRHSCFHVDILFIETSISPGKGNLTLTGNLGDVMKESASIALEFIKAHAKEIGIDKIALAEFVNAVAVHLAKVVFLFSDKTVGSSESSWVTIAVVTPYVPHV